MTGPNFTRPAAWSYTDATRLVPLTLYNFSSQYATRYYLLFMDVLLITVPPLLMFPVANRRIVAGLTAGGEGGERTVAVAVGGTSPPCRGDGAEPPCARTLTDRAARW